MARASGSLFGEPQEVEQGGHIVRVVFDSGVDGEFDYVAAERLWPVKVGSRVEVPFGRGNRRQVGFCVEAGLEEVQSAAGRGRPLKRVEKVIDAEPLVDGELMELGRWISEYYVCPLGQVLGAMVPAAVKRGAGVTQKSYVYLAAGAGEAADELRGAKQKAVVSFLSGRNAFDSASAVEQGRLLEAAGCKAGVLKRLAEKEIIKFIRRAVLKSLPAVPEPMATEAEVVELNEEQAAAQKRIEAGIESGRFGVTVVYGVTDSGKTELYIRAIEKVLRSGRGAIVLLPEIALTAQTVQRFRARFDEVAVLHSGLSASARNAQWQKIKSGEARVVIGARSAIFAPVVKPGLVVIDEEHEPSYKQDTAPRYNGRDVAIKRAQLAGAHCILGSATPSLESVLNCRRKGHFAMVRLRRRVLDLPMPRMRLVDMRRQPGAGRRLLSGPLRDKLSEVLGRGEQAILLLNRRGYSNFIFCPRCRHTLRCRNCDVTLTFHRAGMAGGSGGIKTIAGAHLAGGYAVCHYCLSQTLVPERCALCGAKMQLIGTGSQRLEEELGEVLSGARVRRVDSDSMRASDYYEVLDAFSRGEVDVLAGTQMLAKGLHFPNVTLVGVVSADTSLSIPDFRANERTFQLICQVAGRAGRSEKRGEVIVQTFLPGQAAIEHAVRYDYEGFVRAELAQRQACNLPPYWRLARMVLRDTDFEKLTAAADVLRGRVDEIVRAADLPVVVRGPMPAAISRIQRFHRLQIIIQAPEPQMMARFFSDLRQTGKLARDVRCAIDVDPVNLL